MVGFIVGLIASALIVTYARVLAEQNRNRKNGCK